MSNFLIATPVSNLMVCNNKFTKHIMELSDCFELRDHSVKFAFSDNKIKEKTYLYHSDLQIIHKFEKDELKNLFDIANNFPKLKHISFHVASCYKNPIIKNNKFYENGKKSSKNQMSETLRDNIFLLRREFGKKINFMIENNNYYKTKAYDYVCDPKFLNHLCCENKINLLLDTAHAHISAKNNIFQFISFHNYIKELPKNILQLHVSRYSSNENEFYDAHYLPGIIQFNEIRSLISRFKSIKYISLEYYRDSSKLTRCLKNLKKLQNA